jgi:RNA polymerase sigma-70 factor (ECF subfamily)
MREHLEAACRAARERHPGLALDDEAFIARLSHAAGDEPLEKIAADDLYLALGCERGDARAIGTLEAEVLARIPAFLAGVRGGDELVDEVRQRTRERLLVAPAGEAPRIADYAGRGPLAAFVRVVAVRIALDLLRQRAPAVGEIEDAIAHDPELSLIRERYREPFRAALRDAFTELAPEERSVLKLHFLEGMNLDRLAAMLHTSRATAGRRVLALRARLAERTRALLGERLGATPEEVASLVAVLQSRLEWSLRSALDVSRAEGST